MVFVVTNYEPGSGKTTLATMLSLILSESESVLGIDLCINRGYAYTMGLEYLNSADEKTLITVKEKLTMMPLGDNQKQLGTMNQAKIGSLIQKMKTKYSHIVIDVSTNNAENIASAACLAADKIVCPVVVDSALSQQYVSAFIKMINEICPEAKKRVVLVGVLDKKQDKGRVELMKNVNDTIGFACVKTIPFDMNNTKKLLNNYAVYDEKGMEKYTSDYRVLLEEIMAQK